MIIKKSKDGIKVQVEHEEWNAGIGRAIVADIKEIRGRKFDKEEKVWIIPYSGAGFVEKIKNKYANGKVNLDEYTNRDLAKDNPKLFPVFCPHCHKEIKSL